MSEVRPRPHTLATGGDGGLSTATDGRVGEVVAGRYRVDALLGAGGMGRVYRAVHLALGEPVAIKFLLAEWSSRAEMRARFQREATLLARLRHPGVVSVLDYGDHRGEQFIVMELLQGRSLESLILVDGVTLPVERSASVVGQVLQVLEATHAAGIVHRDLKPENVMLLDAGDRTDRVKVLDFGIALPSAAEGLERLTNTGAMQGTPYYMSPEQCTGRAVGPPADIYSLGVMLFELLTGRLPFEADSVAELLAQQLFAAPPRVSDCAPPRPVPLGLEALVQRAMAKRPEERPTAAAFRDALSLAVMGLDEATRAARDATERARVAGLSRTDRALSPRAPDAPPPALRTVDGSPAARVILWGFEGPRVNALRSALALAGVEAVPWSHEDPPSESAASGVQGVVVAGGALAVERTVAHRAHPALSKLPLVVLDVSDAALAPSLIRAGASDVALTRVDDPTACAKVARALRRGR